MAKIQITEGTWNGDCTADLNLTNAHAKDPAAGYDKVIHYGEKRYLMTFIAAGATNGAFTVARTTDSYKTRIPSVPEAELIDGNAWRYKVMGRIQKAAVILAQVGTATAGSTSSGGFFQLKLRDNMLVYGMNAMFYNGKMARVMAQPAGAPGAYIYQFQCYPGDTFDYSTWVSPQIGEKTCFGGFTTYGERSLTGYGRTFYPEDFIQHFSIQRKGQAITGDANSNRVLWYSIEGGATKGWIYWIEAQARAQFLMEDDFRLKWGKSTMKDANGNLLAAPSMTDMETGMPIWAGDGLYPQIEGANDLDASGTDGCAVWDDFVDMVKAAKRRSNSDGNTLFYCVTGLDGISNVNRQSHLYAKDNFNMTYMVPQNETIGGNSPAIGWWFQRINVEGCQVQFIVDPMMDDIERFPRRLNSNGQLAMSNTYYFLDATPDNTGKPNIEIRTKGREGVNRNMVYFYENGMTGEGKPENAKDGKEFQMLKQNMLVIYNTKSCGIIKPPTTA